MGEADDDAITLVNSTTSSRSSLIDAELTSRTEDQSALVLARLAFEDISNGRPSSVVSFLSTADVDFVQLASTAATAEKSPADPDLGFTVDLAHRSLDHIPAYWIELVADRLRRLAISYNPIQKLPPSLSLCQNLRYLNMRFMKLTEIPSELFSLSNLEIVDMARNRISSIPPDIINLKRLKVLALNKNEVQKIPIEISFMPELKVLKIAGNPLIQSSRALVSNVFDHLTDKSSEVVILADLTRQLQKYLQNLGVKIQIRDPYTEEVSLPDHTSCICSACSMLGVRLKRNGKEEDVEVTTIPNYDLTTSDKLQDQLRVAARCERCETDFVGVYDLKDKVICCCRRHCPAA